jgi:hypothetical protein
VVEIASMGKEKFAGEALRKKLETVVETRVKQLEIIAAKGEV